MSIKVTVKQHEGFSTNDHIDDVGLVYRGDRVIILKVNMKTKYKGIDAYGGATDEEVQSVWVGGDEIQLTLPPEFKHNIMFSEPGRYEFFLCIFQYSLLEEWSDSEYNDVILWERPDDDPIDD